MGDPLCKVHMVPLRCLRDYDRAMRGRYQSTMLEKIPGKSETSAEYLSLEQTVPLARKTESEREKDGNNQAIVLSLLDGVYIIHLYK